MKLIGRDRLGLLLIGNEEGSYGGRVFERVRKSGRVEGWTSREERKDMREGT